MAYVLINGKKLPTAQAVVPITDRGFRYGDGVFETVAIHGGAPFRLDWHLKRLARGLHATRIAFSVRTLEKECRMLIIKNKVKDGLLRIQVTRGSGGRGTLPERKTKPTCVIETLPPPEIPKKPVTLWLSSYRRAPSALARHKLCQGLNATLARLEAEDHGCFEALMLNARGEICETSSANIFWLKGGTLYTPSLSCGALEGSMRALVMALAPYKVRQVRAGLKTLAGAEAVFLTNAAWGVLPVAGLKPQNRRWNSAGIAKTLNALLKREREKHCQRRRQALQIVA